MRMIFVNLPVKSVTASRAFFGALGFTFNEQFSNENTTAMVVEENIVVMLLEHARFQDFITGEIADTARGKEVLVCLSAGSRAEVEETKAKATRVAAGHWQLRGDTEIDDWYDESGAWQSLKGKLTDGSMIEYRRV